MRQAGTRADADAGQVLRLLRSGLLAAATLAVAAWAHGSAGGNLPGSVGLLAIWLIATAVVAPTLGRPASYRRVLALVTGGQFGLHLLLSLVAGHGPRPAQTAAAAYYAEHSMLAEPGTVAPALHGDATALSSGLGSLIAELTSADGLLMTAAHLGASLLLGLWLATGERLLWFGLRRIAATARYGLAAMVAVLAWVRGIVPTPTSPPIIWPAVVGLPVRSVWLVAPRRGPPRVA